MESIRRRLLDGEQVRVPATPFLVRRPRRELGQNAGHYVKCELGDQTGWIEAVWWGAGRLGQPALEKLMAAQVWSVAGTATLSRYGGRETSQIKVDAAEPLDAADPAAIPGLVRRSSSSEEELGGWLSAQIATVQRAPLRLLLEATLGERGAWRIPFLRAPAGLYYHHPYVGGLIDHVREMASIWTASSFVLPGVDRELTLAGILLHDVGKLDCYAPGPAPQLSRAGRFTDHITSGIARLSLAIDRQPDFPPPLRDHLLHIVASHHGEKEHGSPIVPATREAVVVHHLDRLTSLLGHFDEWARQSGVDPHGWSTDSSPWLKARLAIRPEMCDAGPEDGDGCDAPR